MVIEEGQSRARWCRYETVSPYRIAPENVPPGCRHRRLLNRGSPPNTSNQRVCADCKRTFDPPRYLGGPVTSNDAGPRITIADWYEERRARIYSPTKGYWMHSDGTPIEHPEQDARGILKGLQQMYPEDAWELDPLEPV